MRRQTYFVLLQSGYSESLQRNLARLDHKVFDVRIIVAYNCRAAKYSSATANLPAN